MSRLFMDEMICQLESLTERIIGRLYEASYEEMEQFVEERQMVIDGIGELIIASPMSAPQKKWIQDILNQDPAIVARMNALKIEAQDWLQQRNHARTQRNAYEAGYATDSFLMDRRK